MIAFSNQLILIYFERPFERETLNKVAVIWTNEFFVRKQHNYSQIYNPVQRMNAVTVKEQQSGSSYADLCSVINQSSRRSTNKSARSPSSNFAENKITCSYWSKFFVDLRIMCLVTIEYFGKTKFIWPSQKMFNFKICLEKRNSKNTMSKTWRWRGWLEIIWSRNNTCRKRKIPFTRSFKYWCT